MSFPSVKVEIVAETAVMGEECHVQVQAGDVLLVTEADAAQLVSAGKAKLVSPVKP